MWDVTPSPELPVVEGADTLEIESPMPVGKRVVFFLLALFPLLAPYQLLWKPRWTGYLNLFFLFALLVSAGAMCVSALLAWAAVGGIRSRMTFDRTRGLFTYTAWAPAMGTRTTRVPLDAIAAASVKVHEWSDGPDSYSLEISTRDQKTFATSSSWSRSEVEALRERVDAFRGAPRGDRAVSLRTPGRTS